MSELRVSVAAPVDRVIQVGRVVIDPTRPPAVAVDPHPFVGRRAELAALDAVDSGVVDSGVVLVGEPGIGTTRLACEWASRHHDEVLVLDVAAGSCPLRRALLALGAPRIPDEPGSRVGLVRSLLRARPVPVVLDGVSTEVQARAFPTGWCCAPSSNPASVRSTTRRRRR